MTKLSRYFEPKFSWLALPFAAVFFIFFVIPLLLTIIVSFWDYNDYSIIPDLIFENYIYIFEGCFQFDAALCMTFKTYLSTLYFCLLTWVLTLLIGFSVAYFFGILRENNTSSNRIIFNLYHSILDIKCN
jgi:putative spermidine/putrescine transport system permease protein